MYCGRRLPGAERHAETFEIVQELTRASAATSRCIVSTVTPCSHLLELLVDFLQLSAIREIGDVRERAVMFVLPSEIEKLVIDDPLSVTTSA